MKLSLHFGIKLKLSIAIIVMYAVFFGIGYIAIDNLDEQEQAISILDENIFIHNGINEMKGLILEDQKLVEGLTTLENEGDLEQLWIQHNEIIENIRDTVSKLEKIDSEIITRISDSWNNYSNGVLPEFKEVYNLKSKQIIYVSLPDSLTNTKRIKQNIADSKAKIYTNIDNILAKLTGLEREIKADLGGSITEYRANTKDKKTSLLLINIAAASLSLIVFLLFFQFLFKGLDRLRQYAKKLANGELSQELKLKSKDEMGQIARYMNTFVEHVHSISRHLDRNGENQEQSEVSLKPLSDNDILGKSFLKMNDNLKKTNEAAQKMREQEAIQNWATVGVAKFGEILRQQTKDNNELSYNIIKALIEYINANQGGLFIYNDEQGEPFLELMATYAYGRRKFKERQLQIGEGLVGTCAQEAQTIYMTNIPDDYIEIESYLGHATPKSLLIVPLKLDDNIFGIIELASFHEIKEHEIKFVEDLAETIASTLATAKINAKTADLLEKSREQSEALLAQEEEMRQNLEELQSTQEEADRRERMLQEELDRARQELEDIRFELNEIKRRQDK